MGVLFDSHRPLQILKKLGRCLVFHIFQTINSVAIGIRGSDLFDGNFSGISGRHGSGTVTHLLTKHGGISILLKGHEIGKFTAENEIFCGEAHCSRRCHQLGSRTGYPSTNPSPHPRPQGRAETEWYKGDFCGELGGETLSDVACVALFHGAISADWRSGGRRLYF
jgi:hypothetical protein